MQRPSGRLGAGEHSELAKLSAAQNRSAAVIAAAIPTRFPFERLQAMVTWDYTGKIQPAWRLMRQCFKSQPG